MRFISAPRNECGATIPFFFWLQALYVRSVVLELLWALCFGVGTWEQGLWVGGGRGIV